MIAEEWGALWAPHSSAIMCLGVKTFIIIPLKWLKKGPKTLYFSAGGRMRIADHGQNDKITNRDLIAKENVY